MIDPVGILPSQWHSEARGKECTQAIEINTKLIGVHTVGRSRSQAFLNASERTDTSFLPTTPSNRSQTGPYR